MSAAWPIRYCHAGPTGWGGCTQWAGTAKGLGRRPVGRGFRIHWAVPPPRGWAGGRPVGAIGENAAKGKCRRTGRWAGRVAPQRPPWATSPCCAGLMAVTGKDRGGRREVRPVNDLTVLTPPLLMCAAFLIAVGAFLRHEMVASRRRRDRDQSADISGESTIPDSTSSQATARPDDAGASRAD